MSTVSCTPGQLEDAVLASASTARWPDGSLLLELDENVLREVLVPQLLARVGEHHHLERAGVNRRRHFGRCPHCGRTVWTEPLCPRPHLVNGLAVHQRCYRLLTAPHDPELAPGTTAAALNTHPA